MKPQPKDLEKILLDHSLWVLSEQKKGEMARLEGWNLDGAILEMANLPIARLQFASLRGAVLEGGNFRQAKLNRVNLKEARLAGADFESADLSGANLSYAECEGANFAKANLEGVNFESANLDETSFKEANLRGANFKNAILSFADLSGAALDGANFDGTDFDGTNFKETILEKDNLKETHFKDADMSEFDIDHLKLKEDAKNGDDNVFNLIVNNGEPPKTGPVKRNLEKKVSHKKIRTKEPEEKLFYESHVIKQDIIAEAVGEFIQKLKSNIDPNQVKQMCNSKYGIKNIDRISYEGGDIVARKGQVTFQLDFKISHKLRIYIGPKGNLDITL